MTTLLPCPFCGEEPMVDNCACDGKGEHAPGPDDWLVGCANQQCQMNAFSYTQESEEDAAILWNTREGKKKFDRQSYMREYMKEWREKQRGKV